MEKIIDTSALIDSLRILLLDRSKTREELAELVIGLIEEAGRECDPESMRPRGRWENFLVEVDGAAIYAHFHNDEKCKYFYADHDCAGMPFCPNCGARMKEMIKNGTEET